MSEDKYSHYYKDVSGLNAIDVYGVCEIFEINDPSGATQHAIKKLLCSGQRGVKGRVEDLIEAAATINRLIELLSTNKGQGFTPVGETHGKKKFLEDAYDQPDNPFDINDLTGGECEHLNLQCDDNDDYYEE